MAIPAGSEYVALGSSFAAGPGLRPRAATAPKRSGRSDINYAHILAKQLDLKLLDVSYSGATTSDLAIGIDRPAQLDSVGTATRLITITAGGNDVGYLPSLTFASLPWPLRQIPTIKRRVTEATHLETTDLRFATLESNLTDVVRHAKHLAPNATIVLVDYLRILPGPTSAVSATELRPLSPELIAWGQWVAERMSDVLSSVADAEGVLFMDVGEQSREHHAWSEEPWTRTFHLTLRGGAAYHPNAKGMAAVAAMLLRQLA